MAKEAQYKQQLQSLGVYDPAFDGVIHVLCIQERELSRAMKAWKATAGKDEAPLITDPLYAEISKLRRQAVPPSETTPPPASGNAAFGELLNTLRGKANGQP